jgi:type I restriction enzyme S subunit
MRAQNNEYHSNIFTEHQIMTVEKTQENLSTALEKTEQALGGLENSLGNNEEASLLATAENSEANDGLPEGWANCQIADIAEVNPKKIDAEPDVISGFVPMSHAPTSFQGRLKYDEKPWGDIQKSYTNFKDKDVIFAKVTPCFENGKAVIVRGLPSGIGAGSSEFYVLRAHENCISEKLIFALIKTYQFAQEGAANMTGAVGLRRVPRSFVERFPVALPPLAEQTVIAQTLDTLLAQVDNIKTRLDAIPKILKTFRQSVLAAAVNGKLTEEWRGENECGEIDKSLLAGKFELADDFSLYEIPSTWYFSPIGNVADFQQGMQIAKSTRHKEDGEGRLPILRIGNYSTSFTDDVDYVDIDESSLIAEPEDIILTRTGESRGRVLTGFRGVFHNNTFRINYNTELLVRSYLIYLLNNNQIHDFILVSSGRSAQPDLTHKKFGPCPVSLPPLNEQTQIVHQVEELFAFADQIEQQVKNAQGRVNNLTQSILAKAFRGELTTQWRAENPDLISGDNSAEALLAKIKEERENLKPKKSVKNKSNAKTE